MERHIGNKPVNGRSGDVFISYMPSECGGYHVFADRMAERQMAFCEGLPDLTNRQREILRLLAEAHSYKEIGRRMGGISARTVSDHRARLLEKFDVGETSDLCRIAREGGLLNP